MKLLSADYIIDDIEPGETRRFDHKNCSAGEDTRRRLYLTRPVSNTGRVIGYCHNCQEGGSLWDGEHETYRNDRHEPTNEAVTIVEDVEPPNGLVDILQDWTVNAQVWAMSNGLADHHIRGWHIAQDPTSGRVYLPRYRSMYYWKAHEGYNGYQLRNVEGNRGAKYITAHTSDDPGFTEMMTGTAKGVAVIVEDLVSGIHLIEALHKFDDVGVIVNYGVKINLEALHAMTQYARSIVWLDNDSAHVNETAQCMARTLRLLSTNACHVIVDSTDPKHYNAEDIEEIFDGLN